MKIKKTHDLMIGKTIRYVNLSSDDDTLSIYFTDGTFCTVNAGLRKMFNPQLIISAPRKR